MIKNDFKSYLIISNHNNLRSIIPCRQVLVFFLLLRFFSSSSQNISYLRDSLSFKTLQDTFCSCVNRHAGENSKDWGDAVALALFLKLDNRTPEYQSAEYLLRHQFPAVSMRRLDQLLDSLLISDSFGKCLSLWTVNLKDRAGFYKMIYHIRLHPPFLQLQTIHLREQVGQILLHSIQQGVSDSMAILFDRSATFDSIRHSLEQLHRETVNKLITPEMKFERLGRDSSGICKMKLLRDGLHDMGGIRITYRRDDPYGKIERIGMLLRDSFEKEDLITSPSPPASPPR